MENRYSKKLTRKAKKIFEKQSGRSLTDDEVEMQMDKICRIMLLYGKVMSRKINTQNNEISRKKV